MRERTSVPALMEHSSLVEEELYISNHIFEVSSMKVFEGVAPQRVLTLICEAYDKNGKDHARTMCDHY